MYQVADGRLFYSAFIPPSAARHIPGSAAGGGAMGSAATSAGGAG